MMSHLSFASLGLILAIRWTLNVWAFGLGEVRDKYVPQVGQVVFWLFTFDQQVVYINFHIAVNLLFEHVVHESLEGGLNIFQPKGHDQLVVQFAICYK